jgi:predicted phosphodiesterase
MADLEIRLADGARVLALADCHIHAGGPAFRDSVLAEAARADLVVTLGDMGEASGLDQLGTATPVIGVRGQDDSDDPRTANRTLVLESLPVVIGCVFDPVAAGLAASADPLQPVEAFGAAARRVFGRPITTLLYASTHKWALEEHPFGDAANPGSAVLPADGGTPTGLLFEVRGSACMWTRVFFP